MVLVSLSCTPLGLDRCKGTISEAPAIIAGEYSVRDTFSNKFQTITRKDNAIRQLNKTKQKINTGELELNFFSYSTPTLLENGKRKELNVLDLPTSNLEGTIRATHVLDSLKRRKSIKCTTKTNTVSCQTKPDLVGVESPTTGSETAVTPTLCKTPRKNLSARMPRRPSQDATEDAPVHMSLTTAPSTSMKGSVVTLNLSELKKREITTVYGGSQTARTNTKAQEWKQRKKEPSSESRKRSMDDFKFNSSRASLSEVHPNGSQTARKLPPLLKKVTLKKIKKKSLEHTTTRIEAWSTEESGICLPGSNVIHSVDSDNENYSDSDKQSETSDSEVDDDDEQVDTIDLDRFPVGRIYVQDEDMSSARRDLTNCNSPCNRLCNSLCPGSGVTISSTTTNDAQKIDFVTKAFAAKQDEDKFKEMYRPRMRWGKLLDDILLAQKIVNIIDTKET
jgi:hypothetical protein